MCVGVRSLSNTSNVRNLLNPSRIILDYLNTKLDNLDEKKLDVRIESIVFSLLVYDFALFKSVAQNFYIFKSVSRNQTGQFRSKFIVNIDGESIQLNLSDLILGNISSYFHIQLTNLSGLMVTDPVSKNFDFSTSILCNCYNNSLGDWEPLVED